MIFGHILAMQKLGFWNSGEGGNHTKKTKKPQDVLSFWPARKKPDPSERGCGMGYCTRKETPVTSNSETTAYTHTLSKQQEHETGIAVNSRRTSHDSLHNKKATAAAKSYQLLPVHQMS